MKKFVSILALIGILLATPSCTDWLTLKPENDLVLEDYWKSESDVNEVVAACYVSLMEDAFMERMMAWGEVRSDNIVLGRGMTLGMYQMMNFEMTTSNYLCQWGAPYNTINICNTFLYYAPDVTKIDSKFTESEYLALEAEVLTIRALTYFYLVRAFGEVPWVDQPSLNDTQNYQIAKSDEDFILDHIVADLLKAEQYALTSFNDNVKNKGRVTVKAVQSLLADIYLWRGQYQECVAACDKVIADNSFKLVDDDEMLYRVFYTKNSTESIFELQFENNVRYNNLVAAFYGSSSSPNGGWALSDALIALDNELRIFNLSIGQSKESEKDIRRYDFINVDGLNWIFKYSGAIREEDASGKSTYNYRSNSANWIVYRLSDILLMKAEALVQLNRSNSDLESALKLVNQTYLRSNPELGEDSLKILDYGSPIQMEELVLRERQRELMFEGKRWFDLVRVARRKNSADVLLKYVGNKLSGSAGSSKLSTMDALYLPIHIDEMSANKALVQNPFYEISSSSK